VEVECLKAKGAMLMAWMGGEERRVLIKDNAGHKTE